MAKVKRAKVTVDANGVLTFVFAENAGTVVFDPSKVNEETGNRLRTHGAGQKIRDSYAGAETLEEAFLAASTVANNLSHNIYSARGEGSEGGVTMLVEALYRCTKDDGDSLEDCAATIADMGEEQIEGLAKLPPVKAALDAIRAERAAVRAAKSAEAAKNTKIDLSSLRG